MAVPGSVTDTNPANNTETKYYTIVASNAGRSAATGTSVPARLHG